MLSFVLTFRIWFYPGSWTKRRGNTCPSLFVKGNFSKADPDRRHCSDRAEWSP